MYIKVHKKGKDWFRYDKGTLVGKDVPYGEIFEHLKHLLGDKKFFIKNKKMNIYLYIMVILIKKVILFIFVQKIVPSALVGQVQSFVLVFQTSTKLVEDII